MNNWIEKLGVLIYKSIFITMFAGATLYSADRLGSTDNIREILFWGFMMLMIIREFAALLRVSDTPQDLSEAKKE